MTVGATQKAVTLTPLRLAPLPPRPLVSVLVANYNYDRFVGKALESAFDQTYNNLEIIICDDGSSDQSLAVIERYARMDDRVRVIRKRNGGHGSALNAAYAASSGDVICLLDSDDQFLPKKIERVVENFQGHPESGFVIHRIIRIDAKGTRQGVWPLSVPLPEGWQAEEMLRSGGVLPYIPPTSGLSFRRELAMCMFPMPEQPPLGVCPDQVMMRLAPLLTPVTPIDEALTEYRLHSSNTYETGGITLAFLEREIAICEALWAAQRRFLASRSRELAEQLTPLEQSPYLLHLNYVHARFARSRDARELHRRYIEDLKSRPDARYLRFWQFSIYLPSFLFVYAVNFMSRQSALKQLIARLKGHL